MNTSNTPIKEKKLVIRFFVSAIDKKPSLLHKATQDSINWDLDSKGINVSETVLGWIKALEDTKAFLVENYGFGRGSIGEYSEIVEVKNA